MHQRRGLLRACLAVVWLWLAQYARAAATADFDAIIKILAPPQRTGAAVTLTGPTGDVHKAYMDVHGHVHIAGLPEGAYVLDVLAIGYMFPQYRVDVRPRFDDAIAVAPVTTRMPLAPPFILEPLGEAKYFTERKPVDIRRMLMSPYGLMAVAGLFMLVVGPSMKVDPEEMKQMRAEMKDSPLSFLMGKEPSATAAADQPALATASARRTSGNSVKKKR